MFRTEHDNQYRRLLRFFTAPGLPGRLKSTARDWKPRTAEGWAVVSGAAHVLVFLLIINWWWLGAHRMNPAGTATGTHTVLLYKPGKLAAPTKDERHFARTLPRKVLVVLPKSAMAPMETPASSSTLDAPKADGEAGDDAKGDGSASLSFVQSFPNRQPDFSSVGATADIVIDLQLDETGRVVQTFLRQGINSAVDSAIIATVRQWLFNPARKAGKPIASVQELHFRYSRAATPGPCGWECLGLMSH